MTPAVGTTAAIAALRTVDSRWRTAADDQLLADGRAWEEVGRLVDAARIAFAAEVEARSGSGRGEGSLAFRQGERDAAGLVAHTMRISLRTAKRWVAVGTALAPGVSVLSGEETPGRFPVLRSAVRAGLVGIDSARVIAGMLHRVQRRADPDAMEAAEADLTAEAIVHDTEAIREASALRAEALDPDGPRPRERKAHLNRTFRLGRVDGDGGSRFWGYLPAEQRAILQAAFSEARAARAMMRSATGDESNEDLDAEWRETDGEHRTPGQLDFDTFWGLLTAGIRASAAEGTAASALRTVPQVIVTTTAEDLRDPQRGTGWIGGVRVPVQTVERLSCGADVRLLVEGDEGEPLWLGRPVRLFSKQQRRAMIVRFRGCAWPGCAAPPAWCDAHHIAWYERDDGPTDVGNGVLLCSFHHHLIHSPICDRRIVVHRGHPHLVPRRWTGPPDRSHRMAEHPRRLLPRVVDDDPWARRR